MSVNSRSFWLILHGNVAIILGLSLIIFQANIMGYIAEILLNLQSDSVVFDMWKKHPMRVPYSFTFFNWTNHEDFFNRSIKPKFDEIGPYTFSHTTERVDVVRNDNNNTVSFKQIRVYEYDNNLAGNGNLSDRLTTFNYVTMVSGFFTKAYINVLKDILSEYISTFNPYYYFDTTIEAEVIKGNNNLLIDIFHYLEFLGPNFPLSDGFGWLRFRNGDKNFEGAYNIGNGVNRQFDVVNWKYQNTTPAFHGPCKIKGSLGYIHSAPLNKEFVNIFIAEICRHFTFYFEKEVVVDGVIGYKYSFTKLSLDNGTLNPENKCFCGERCVPSGVIDIGACYYGMTMFVSLPHFYNADPIYLEPMDGLNPDKQKHESYVVVEPNSLLSLEVNIKAQVNSYLEPIDGISVFDDYPKLYFPLFWVSVHAQLPDDLMKYLKVYLYIPYVTNFIASILLALGIILTCYGVYNIKRFRLLKRSQSKDKDFVEKFI